MVISKMVTIVFLMAQSLDNDDVIFLFVSWPSSLVLSFYNLVVILKVGHIGGNACSIKHLLPIIVKVVKISKKKICFNGGHVFFTSSHKSTTEICFLTHIEC